jgi:hypothetical protein
LVLKRHSSSNRLLLYTLETLDRFFAWDLANAPNPSVRDFFDKEGGLVALNDLQTTNLHTEVYSATLDLQNKYFKEQIDAEEEEMNYLFNKDYVVSANNIYDDT